ncbi:GIY-YIG nuclease family protein [Candidatus Omnitrophota bacterium]
MAYYVYILISSDRKRTYTGCTQNIEQRLNEHNTGKVKSSKPYLPYKVLYSEQFATLKEARSKERYFKSTSGRKKIKSLLQDR